MKFSSEWLPQELHRQRIVDDKSSKGELREDHQVERSSAAMESFRKKREGILADEFSSVMVSNELNSVPFWGSGKMALEAVVGKSVEGKKMTGKERIIHAAMAAGSLALDFVDAKEMDRVMIVGKGVALMEKIGSQLANRGAVRGARIFVATAEFMARNPEITARVELLAEEQIRRQIKKIEEYKKKMA